ncbi:taurochenodeoxycholic 6 alpha-hydroxylase-like [Gigantopelta aegis]|uniref:taurochenodeoxycholic 6 alpha-hydroxylase-like n=1 Tax=Gigantopelta aegis TaxID=1735272 RepID=UPI001B88859A|nr:taurochenodeoxycholic 6 alpha-hydroxylase-like [Gigantopelta aegis]XP_041359179.1 taurochenodeoxycholic 6 alpha-hydroxylase-like [Gigantopelta aegis]XP_041359180.1 taurochenodeoxycholic 6 alpha-hydroxylase-like [Gigantopelta aegis]
MYVLLHQLLGFATQWTCSGTLTSALLVAGFLVCLGFFYKIIVSPYLSPLRKIPGPYVPSLLLGNIKELYTGNAIDPFVRWINTFGSGLLVYAELFGDRRVLIADAEATKQVLITKVKNYKKPKLYRLFDQVVGNGLLNLNGNEHLVQRKLCQGAFKLSVIKNVVPSLQNHAEELASLWSGKLLNHNETELSIGDDLHHLTLDVVTEFSCGYKCNALINPDQPESQAFEYLLKGFTPSLLRTFLPNVAYFLSDREYSKNLDMSNKLVKQIIQNKRAEISHLKDESKCSDLLSMMLFAECTVTGMKFSEEQLRDNIMTFMLAGHESTAATLIWTLYCLSEHQSVQTRVRDEMMSEIPKEGKAITFENLDNLTYMSCLIKETLRLYPAASMVFREAVHNDYINGYFIPAGTILNVNIGALHRNPKYWDNADEFNPDRFLDESKLHSCSFLPFLVGSRTCIGFKFALLEIKITLCTLLRHFKFSPVPGVTYKKCQMITVRPDPPMRLVAEIIS